jgi:hypothetical protein
MRVLFIQQDWPTWKQSRHWSYAAHLGFEQGLRTHGVKCITLTTPLLKHAMKKLQGCSFDQIWINDLVHLEIDESWYRWFMEVAPIRIGLLVESLEYYADEIAVFPILKDRKQEVIEKIKYLTHVVTCDEKDAVEISKKCLSHALWSPFSIPKNYINQGYVCNPKEVATYSGALYGERSQWLKIHKLQPLLIKQSSPEDQTIFPAMFNSLHSRPLHLLHLLPGGIGWRIYINLLRMIRRKCFSLWLEGMQSGSAIVNLPHFVKTYTPRVIEGMAAGNPVISWEIPERPRNRELFEDGKEILLYSKNDPDQLIEQIRLVIGDPNLRTQLIKNARKKVLQFHTTEFRVQQILKWIEIGENPSYG